jgi:hypothetical protein
MGKAASIMFALIYSAISAHAQSLSAEDLNQRNIERRAVEAVIWGMPAVNTQLLYDATLGAGGNFNQVVYWSRLISWKNQTLTPNPDTIYFFPFYDTRVGPVVLEIPPADRGSITGSVDDAWQTAIEDVGPAGVDKGNGGKYLLLPPGYDGKVPAGYIPMRSSAYTGFAILRSNLKSASDDDIAEAVAYGKRIKLYPLSQTSKPPPTKFVDAIDARYGNVIPYNVKFFEELDRFVQREPWLERDKAMIDQLKSIGIEKNKPFDPDAKTREILEAAAHEAQEWLDAKYEAFFSLPYFEGTHWAVPAPADLIKAMQTDFAGPDSYPTDERGAEYSFIYFSTKHLGHGQFYVMEITDREGRPFDGGKSYHLNVPANAPVKLYWSATAYDRDTHALIRDVLRGSRASNSPDLQKNADSSVDVWFGPQAPVGKESNWVPTHPSAKFEVLFRLYGPEKPLFDKTWKLPDIEMITAN